VLSTDGDSCAPAAQFLHQLASFPGNVLQSTAALDDRQPKAKVFISYSRKDVTFADRLEPALKARGLEPLIDRSEVYATGGSASRI
jgi:hypothetical protein